MPRSLTTLLLPVACLLVCSGCHLLYPTEVADDPQDMQALDLSEDRAELPIDAAPELVVLEDAPADLTEQREDVPEDLSDAAIDMTWDMAPAFDPRTEPMRVLFLGNSFTHQGPVPDLVQALAEQAGWPSPQVTFVAPGGKSLAYHREHTESLQAVDRGGWHAVVLQDLSTRPTDNTGDPEAFKQDALWFFERVQGSSPGARVVLYMTWARHPNHGIYPNTFTDPDQMQDQLAFHYRDAAARFIPDGTGVPGAATLVELAPVGEVWRHHLMSDGALRLHAQDDYHAGTYGQWLNALTIYATLYGRRVVDLPIPEVDPREQPLLTASVDAITGQEVLGGPDAEPFEPWPVPELFDVGDQLFIDFGPGETSTEEPGWNNVSVDTVRASALVDQSGDPTDIALEMVSRFTGMNTSGSLNNTLGFPGSASRDSLWSGDFGTHEEALMTQGALKLVGLEPQGVYEVRLFASRMGRDEDFSRLGRYQIGGQEQDFDATDNEGMLVIFARVQPTPQGEIELTVNVSPDGAARYSYLGVMQVERIE